MDPVTDTRTDSDSGSTVRVAIVDDDALVRAGLRLMLAEHDDIEVVGEAADGRQGVALVGERRPDVVLMDIRMPRLDGLEATRELMARPSPPRVIVLTTFDADEHVVLALGAGADGFLLKDTSPGDIVEAIRRVAAGDPMLSPSVARTLIDRLRQDGGGHDRARKAERLVDTLTGREQEVARAVGRGLSNAEIAAELHLSVPTVKGYVTTLFEKLGATNRTQIAIRIHDASLG